MRTQFGNRVLDSGICVLCGVRKATTKEHIPPRALFDEHPKEYLSVPACDECNNSTKLDDEYLLQVMAGASLVGEGVSVWRKKVKPKINAFPKTRIGLRNQLSLTSVDINPKETIELPAMKLNRQRIEKSIAKLAWGLYWFHTQRILSQEAILNVGMVNVAEGPTYFDNPENKKCFNQTVLGIYRDPKVMNTFFYTAAISTELSLWYFFFYKQNTFIVTVHEN
jgi:hypothetical protein